MMATHTKVTQSESGWPGATAAQRLICNSRRKPSSRTTTCELPSMSGSAVPRRRAGRQGRLQARKACEEPRGKRETKMLLSSASTMNLLCRHLCPLTNTLMRKPVTICDGSSFESDAINEWLAEKNYSPKTKLRLQTTTLVPNHSLRGAIDEWRASKGMGASANGF